MLSKREIGSVRFIIPEPPRLPTLTFCFCWRLCFTVEPVQHERRCRFCVLDQPIPPMRCDLCPATAVEVFRSPLAVEDVLLCPRCATYCQNGAPQPAGGDVVVPRAMVRF
jgi:hypothetical protein